MNRLFLTGVLGAFCGLLAWQAADAGLVMPVNLARQGTASQSSTGAGGTANRGNDGGLGPSFSTDKTTTHTSDAAFSKWEVDLGTTFDLSQVDLYSRGDCCSPLRLGDFRVNVLDAPAGSVVHSQHFAGSVPQNSVQGFSLPAGTSGQVVQVQIVGENGGANDGLNNAGNGILSLREVVVNGKTEVANLTNLSGSYGTANQSSTRSGGGGNAAQFAIDGNTNGNFGSGSVTHTNTQNNPWWTVDLSNTFHVENIRLFNRTDCCGGRLNNANLSVLDESMATVATVNVGTVGSDKNILMPYGTEGRYVRVDLPGNSKVLSLAEVDVVGGVDAAGDEIDRAVEVRGEPQLLLELFAEMALVVQARQAVPHAHLAQFMLQPPLIGNVLANRQNGYDLSRAVRHQRQRHADRDGCPVFQFQFRVVIAHALRFAQ